MSLVVPVHFVGTAAYGVRGSSYRHLVTAEAVSSRQGWPAGIIWVAHASQKKETPIGHLTQVPK